MPGKFRFVVGFGTVDPQNFDHLFWPSVEEVGVDVDSLFTVDPGDSFEMLAAAPFGEEAHYVQERLPQGLFLPERVYQRFLCDLSQRDGLGALS